MKSTRRLVLVQAAALAWTGAAHAQTLTTLDGIRRGGVLRVGVTSAEPWFYKDPGTEAWSGVGIMVGLQLAADLGTRMETVETTWSNAVAALQAGQLDIMLVLGDTPQRRTAVDFPDFPLLYLAMGVLARGDLDASSWSNLDTQGTRIAVTLGTTIDQAVTGLLHSARINRFAENDEAVAAFASRRVDAVAQMMPALVVELARLKVGKLVLPRPVQPVAGSAGLRKSTDRTWVDWISARFQEYYVSGRTQAFYEAYLRSRGIDPAGVPGIVKELWR